MNTEGIKIKLHALGSEGALETLDNLRLLGWATASDVAKSMDTHIATAVKRLNTLHEAGFLDRRVRRGKTRSAQEYHIHSTRIILELDLDEGDSSDLSDRAFLGALLRELQSSLGRFSGGAEENTIQRWRKIYGANDTIITWLENETLGVPNVRAKVLLEFISKVLDAEAGEYGELTIRALAKISLATVRTIHGAPPHELPLRFFRGD